VPEPSDHPIQETTHAIGGTPPAGTASSVGAGAPARLWYLSSQHMTLGVLTVGDLTRPDGNLTQAHLGLAWADPDLARAQLRAPGGMEL
jgi:hypothetical protein